MRDKQQPEKGQLTNEEYLDLYGSKDNMYLQACITTNDYFKLPEDKRRFYMRFCGHNEVYYTLNPMTSPFPVTLPKIEDKAPLSNETKVVESVGLKTADQLLENVFPITHGITGIGWHQIDNEQKQELIEAMETYASRFKNTDAVKVITDRIAELEKLNQERVELSYYWELKEARNMLKLIQP